MFVWLVEEDEGKKRYILKEYIKSEVLKDAGKTKQILNERKVLETIKHPSIINLIATGQKDGKLQLLLSLAKGLELSKIIHCFCSTDQQDGIDHLPVEFV